MSAAVWLGVAGLGGLAAVLRVIIAAGVDLRWPTGLPLGTATVNTAGSFGAGLAVGALAPGDARTLVLVGVLGSLTTFSTWALETHALAAAGRRRPALVNLAAGAALGLAAAELGRLVAG